MHYYTIEVRGSVRPENDLSSSGPTVEVYAEITPADTGTVVPLGGSIRALRWKNGVPAQVPVFFSGVCAGGAFVPCAAIGCTDLPGVWVVARDAADGLTHCLNIHPPDPTAEWTNITWAAADEPPAAEPPAAEPVVGSISQPDLALLAAIEGGL